MDDLEWLRVVYRVLTQRWGQLKNTLVMKDFVDHLIQKRVVTLDYWMGLKAKQITESERTEDFLALVVKFDQKKYQCFLEALHSSGHEDIVNDLLNAQNGNSRIKETLQVIHVSPKYTKDGHNGRVGKVSKLENDTTKDKTESLAMGIGQLKRWESELKKNQNHLMEKEEHLNIKENNLKTREHSLQSIDDLRDQVTSERRVNEENVATLQCKVEDLKQTINELQNKVDTLQLEKEQTNLQISNEISQLRQELTDNQGRYNEKFRELNTQMQAKDGESEKLKSNVEDIVKTITELEKRLGILENENSGQEQKIKEYQKEISSQKKQLKLKEAGINDVKKVLKKTENEKEELIEDLTGLKRDMSLLKAENKQLDRDKRILLGRFAKPQWNNGTRKTSFK